MKILVDNRLLEFNLRNIIETFHSKEPYGEQYDFIKEKVSEMMIMEGNIDLNFLSKIKRYYLLKIRRFDLLLLGLQKVAENARVKYETSI